MAAPAARWKLAEIDAAEMAAARNQYVKGQQYVTGDLARFIRRQWNGPAITALD